MMDAPFGLASIVLFRAKSSQDLMLQSGDVATSGSISFIKSAFRIHISNVYRNKSRKSHPAPLNAAFCSPSVILPSEATFGGEYILPRRVPQNSGIRRATILPEILHTGRMKPPQGKNF